MENVQRPIQSEESFHQILDAIPDKILVKGPHSRVCWANKAFCEYYGMSNAELKSIIDAPFNRPDYTLRYVQDDAYVFNTGKTLDIPEEPVTRADGEVRIFHTVKSPIRDSSGRVVMTVGVSRDITDDLIAKRNLEVERARAVSASKMAALGEMAGGIAHEINTPLTTIQLLASQIANQVSRPEINRELVTGFADKIQATVDRIAKIVVGLRTFSRDGTHDPFVPVRVGALVEETLSFCRERLKDHGVEVHVYHEQPDATLECRQVQISQVLLNLINNAFEATRNDPEKWIRIETRPSGDQIELRVTDSGKGIPSEIADRMFAPFFTTKELGQGTGLGLSISSGIVEAHHGQLTLDRDAPNTRFIITLPRKQVHHDH